MQVPERWDLPSCRPKRGSPVPVVGAPMRLFDARAAWLHVSPDARSTPGRTAVGAGGPAAPLGAAQMACSDLGFCTPAAGRLPTCTLPGASSAPSGVPEIRRSAAQGKHGFVLRSLGSKRNDKGEKPGGRGAVQAEVGAVSRSQGSAVQWPRVSRLGGAPRLFTAWRWGSCAAGGQQEGVSALRGGSPPGCPTGGAVGDA